ncbi:Ethanolamine utilization protein EutA [Anaerovibrio sp. JC8]|uniref:ethanolamine ammonia-lyase reactivating factor EutA n=1 Tax=Anaerovibrio sp. JC8 TaxID=1240085 RepID=UPI000A0C2B50|nr:ethanolamine ammonia-lyase reactivating factor EutA [Anaerovibrio sp. JC8]ORU01203.1 Ethanolamine utilization protein EutA [Anaerovibrio sp. JC8]
MEQEILSAGIDLGTTTSQVIFSRISLENISYTAIPEVRIKNKEIIYKSRIYFTPLTDSNQIDIGALQSILQEEYELAGIKRQDISTGAVIITGETSRKDNAQQALQGLSNEAGDFVVAEAGPDLEAVLAGFGSGAAAASRVWEGNVINFDIGGGTTNAAVFCNEELKDSFALDIGGRLVRLDEQGKILYISDRIKPLIKSLSLPLAEGQPATMEGLKQLTDALARVLLHICHGMELGEAEGTLFINHGIENRKYSRVMFSGGVAECIYSDAAAAEDMGKFADGDISSVGRFGDMGPLLGASIREAFAEDEDILVLEPREKIRATVIGAGSYSLSLSGSTVIMDDGCVPLKNIPVLRLDHPDRVQELSEEYRRKRRLYPDTQQVAISFAGSRAPEYVAVRALAQSLAEVTRNEGDILLVIVEHDFAKALGMLLRQFASQRHIICLDRIHAVEGDYVDVGKTVSGIVPVAVKTLIFKS